MDLFDKLVDLTVCWIPNVFSVPTSTNPFNPISNIGHTSQPASQELDKIKSFTWASLTLAALDCQIFGKIFSISGKWYFAQLAPYWIPRTLDLENLDNTKKYVSKVISEA